MNEQTNTIDDVLTIGVPVSDQDRADTGAFLLTLAHPRGRWLVAALET